MPIRMQMAQGSKEHASHVSYNAAQGPLLGLFKERFKIPDSIPVEGLVFDGRGTIYGTLVDKNLLPLLTNSGLYQYTGGPIRPAEFQLPPVFEPGTLSIAMADGYICDRFQSVLRFHRATETPIHYQTPLGTRDNLCAFISHTAIMACLPREVLQGIARNGPMVVIHQNGSKNPKEYIGHNYSNAYRLSWDEQTQLVQASQIKAPARRGDIRSEKDQARVCKKAIAKSTGVFFVSE